MHTQPPRVGQPHPRTPLKTVLRRSAAGGSALALAGGMVLAAPFAAAAEEVPTSYAQAQFLSGSLLGGDLADVVALEGAVAYNDGSVELVTSKDPLNATALNAVNVNVPGGVQADLGPFADVGAVNQYAEARSGGQSLAAAGAIGDDGGIGVGAQGSGAAGDLSVDLKELLGGQPAGGQLAGVLSDLTLSLKAVAAQAVADLNTASGDYHIAGAVLHVSSPAIADLTDKVLTSLAVVEDELSALSGSNGILAADLAAAVGALGLVATPSISVAISSDLEAAVRPLLTGQYGDSAVSFNLEAGTIDIDLAALHGGTLNNLPPNTELLSSAVLGPVLSNITATLDSLVDSILLRVDQSLRQAQLDVDVDLAVTTPQLGSQQVCDDILIPVVGPIGATVDDVLNGLVGGTIDGVTNGIPLGQVLPGVGGILGGLLGGGSTPVTQPTTVVGYLTQTVCDVVETVVGVLDTSVQLDVHGTVAEVLAGQPASSGASVVALGVPIQLDLPGIIDGLALNLAGGLFDNDGALQSLLAALQLNLLDPADVLTGTAGLDLALTDLLSVKVNVQETTLSGARGMAAAQAGMMFTETAVRVSALGAAVVNVAAATVGPNITSVIDPGCTVNCNPGTPGGPTPTGGGGGLLAMTGVSVGLLVALLAALLAAGTYLAVEGHRKQHAKA